MGGELELNDKEGIFVNCSCTGPWKETENQEQLVQDSGSYLQKSVKYLYLRMLYVDSHQCRK